ncbi:hypothetical protein CWC18_03660 [Pseudoalteromonas aurantia]|uniref:IS110 family transposase n=1 Tax=Pseudoalteromonas aurantia TaxID=43654 RepID=A0ABY2W362_9GAMM|nr:hypothetical protein CWC18_03660 [Pseudoalteromonas aurantia]TMO79000.1 hypothetical protein CWC20_00400 [Pseudoalteromonas aurantia]
MGTITKRGDKYLRKQLIHGARTVVNHAHKKDDDLNLWVTAIKQRRGVNKAAVAVAHRLARLMWILLQKMNITAPYVHATRFKVMFKHQVRLASSS